MARKSKTETDFADAKPRLFERLFKMARGILSTHLGVAQQELREMVGGIVKSFAFIAIAASFLFAFWMLLNVLAILALHDFAGFSYFYSVLIVSGASLLIAVVLLLSARRSLSKKWFPLTRKLIRDTTALFR